MAQQPDPKRHRMNKSLATNLISAGLIGVGYATQSDLLRSVGLFATSGAITNWLAIHMLFEKVPGLYGSGVIPARFEEFKEAIRAMMMDQFFTKENVVRFFEQDGGGHGIDGEMLANAVDYDQVFLRLLEAVNESPLGGMLAMVGGSRALEPVKEPFMAKMRLAVIEIASSETFSDALKSGSGGITDAVLTKVEGIVQARLDELTPKMVKEIIQEMIRIHLGWLVVWGGVFGGLMGVAAWALT